MVCLDLYFPTLGNIGGRFGLVAPDSNSQMTIGMDIMPMLGTRVDTRTGQVSVKTEVADAFKTILAGIGAGSIVFAIMAGLTVREK